jgi:bla regulator protein blaR1
MIDLVGNHLWQSTLFALATALLTFFFRNSHARVRYWLWLAASVKFLIPFSLFISIGSSIDFSWRQSVLIPHTAVSYVENFSQPFGSIGEPTEIPATAKPDQINWIPIILAAIWFIGAIAVSLFYLAGGRNVSAAVRESALLKDHRLYEILQALELRSRCRKRIKLTFSSSTIEPGVFGIFQPILVMPKEIAEQLNDAELEAIVAHEVAHVCRRDNFFSALHMLIEALFWFHPIVWWLGAKLVQERESACDEEVLRLGKDPQAYAEGIVKICEFFVASPLACVAGVSGSDIKKRIHAIMTHRLGVKLSMAKKITLAMASAFTLAFPIYIGLFQTPSSQAQSQTEPMDIGQATVPKDNNFEVVSIKRGVKGQSSGFNSSPLEFRLDNFSLPGAISQVFKLRQDRIIGLPAWTSSEAFSIRARSVVAADSYGEQWEMLIPVLEDRFKLKYHREKRQMPVYELSVEAARVQFPVTVPGSCDPTSPDVYKPTAESSGSKEVQAGPPRNCRLVLVQPLPEGGFKLSVKGYAMADLAGFLEPYVGRPIIDRTGLTALFDIESLSFSNVGITYNSQFAVKYGDKDWQDAVAESAGVPSGLPSIFTALKKVGLRLTRGVGPVEVLVIDRLERPSEN